MPLLFQRIRAYAITSLALPPTNSEPALGAHRTGFALVTSVQSTTLVSPVKHGLFTVAKPLSIATWPAQ
ncbi:MAG TPA: hypothetical protein VN867_02180 [Candidatus Binataceae bacterium]|nr:hypothetical protein [Candidatus Binataceae bacterium]